VTDDAFFVAVDENPMGTLAEFDLTEDERETLVSGDLIALREAADPGVPVWWPAKTSP
jgi:hypothetical protein